MSINYFIPSSQLPTIRVTCSPCSKRCSLEVTEVLPSLRSRTFQLFWFSFSCFDATRSYCQLLSFLWQQKQQVVQFLILDLHLLCTYLCCQLALEMNQVKDMASDLFWKSVSLTKSHTHLGGLWCLWKDRGPCFTAPCDACPVEVGIANGMAINVPYAEGWTQIATMKGKAKIDLKSSSESAIIYTLPGDQGCLGLCKDGTWSLSKDESHRERREGGEVNAPAAWYQDAATISFFEELDSNNRF